MSDGAVLFEALTAAGTDLGGAASFRALTVSATSSPGSAASCSATMAPATASGQASSGSVGDAAVSLEALSAEAFGPLSTSISFATMQASALGLTGTVAHGSVNSAMSASGAASAGTVAGGRAAFAAWTASALSAERAMASGSVSFSRLAASAIGLPGSIAAASVSMEEMRAAATSLHTNVANAAATMRPMRAYARATAAGGSTYRTWVVNARNEAVTEYQNYAFNSYAPFGGSHFAAGPGGIFRLDGAADGTDDIDWAVRTGLLDGRNSRGVSMGLRATEAAQLKRLEEVLMSIRADGPMRLRVWSDDSTYFDYTIAPSRIDALHQVRAKIGRGLRSRFFRVELAGIDNTAAEIHTLQLPMIPLRRRVG